jgi:ParB family chromosome partitioning protein
MSTQTSEWYTRPKYIEAARSVMGSIDLDPASSAAANQIVKAARYYTQEDDGLKQHWRASTVWLNPPYGRNLHYKSTIRLFTNKLIDHFTAGDINQAILLVTTEINAVWFQPLWDYPICFPDHKVKFIIPDGPNRGVYSQMFGTAFVYLGPNEQRFINIFSEFGVVVPKTVRHWHKEQPAALQLWEVPA